jgi:ribulose-phosphate 3-epimerase
MRIYPSLMAADPLNMVREIEILDTHCVGFHLDLMDGHFAPNIALSPMAINAIDRVSIHPVWVHIMATDPERWINRLRLKEGSIITIHIEIEEKIEKLVSLIKERKCQASLAIKPKTPVADLLPHITEFIDQILILSVEPGFYGQKFMPEVLEKIVPLLKCKQQHGLDFALAMDGGIGPEQVSLLRSQGITEVAAATSIFAHNDRCEALQNLSKI